MTVALALLAGLGWGLFLVLLYAYRMALRTHREFVRASAQLDQQLVSQLESATDRIMYMAEKPWGMPAAPVEAEEPTLILVPDVGPEIIDDLDQGV